MSTLSERERERERESLARCVYFNETCSKFLLCLSFTFAAESIKINTKSSLHHEQKKKKKKKERKEEVVLPHLKN